MYVLSILVMSLQTFLLVTAFNFSSLFTFSSPTEPSREGQRSVLVLVENGTEELEAVTAISILSYAEITVKVASIDGPGPVRCAKGVTIISDTRLEDVLSTTFDGIVIPGGKDAADKLSQSPDVGKILKKHAKEYRLIGIATTGALVLQAHRIYFGKRLTSLPEYKKQLKKDYDYLTLDTVVDGSLISSRYPGFSMQFALSLVNHLTSKLVAENVSKQLIPFRTIQG